MSARTNTQSAEKNRRFSFRGIRFLLLVALLYLLAFLFASTKALHALQASWEILELLVPILAVVIFLTAWLHKHFDPKDLGRHLGEESGLRGWMIALGAGVLTHGPMYAWYPLIEDLREHGMRDGLVAAFFYSRAIKVPLLPMMVAYFGLDFTIVLTLMTLLAAWLQGVLLEWIMRR